jgi:hypothetical protein
MKTTIFVIATLLALVSAQSSLDSKVYSTLGDTTINGSCTYAFYPGYSDVTICETTYNDENSWWLPDAYVYNAECACAYIPTKSDTGNCIRQFLVTRINDETRYNAEFRQEMADQKEEYNSNPVQNLVAYKTFILNNFTPMIYQDHQDAYSECCCVGGPAFYAAWEGVTTVPMPNCQSVVTSIEVFGSCSDHPGQW